MQSIPQSGVEEHLLASSSKLLRLIGACRAVDDFHFELIQICGGSLARTAGMAQRGHIHCLRLSIRTGKEKELGREDKERMGGKIYMSFRYPK